QHGIGRVKLLLDIEVIRRAGRTHIGKGVVHAIAANLKQGQSAGGKTGQAQLSSQISSALDREFRREVLAENPTGITNAQVVDHVRREDVIVTKDVLLRIAVDAAVAVHITAKSTNADRRRFRITEVHLVVLSNVVIQTQRVTRLVLLHETLHQIVPDQARIDKVISGRRHVLEQLKRFRIDHAGRNSVAGKLTVCSG